MRWWVQAAPGATVADALALAREAGMDPGLADPARLAIYGQAATPETRLHAGDRIELLRPLLVDPKQARRARAEAHPLKPPKRR